MNAPYTHTIYIYKSLLACIHLSIHHIIHPSIHPSCLFNLITESVCHHRLNCQWTLACTVAIGSVLEALAVSNTRISCTSVYLVQLVRPRDEERETIARSVQEVQRHLSINLAVRENQLFSPKQHWSHLFRYWPNH